MLSRTFKEPPGVFKRTWKIVFTNFFHILILSSCTLLSAHSVVYASIAEHQSVLDLVPLSAVNSQVIKSGPWSNPSIWLGGVLPKSGDNIYVPNGLILDVDIQSNLNFKTIRVDGTIRFATDKNVNIKVDTLVVSQSGLFQVGSEESRLPNSKTVTISIANNGPIDRLWDPTNISRGVIIQGKTRIFGAEKTAFQSLSVYPSAGATQIELTETPSGWVKGDKIAITATRAIKKSINSSAFETQDEIRVIQNISGKIITLGNVNNSNSTEPLSFDHKPLDENMPVYVANLTRNVVFTGEGGNTVPVSQRGHFMVMHNPDAIIKGAGFYHFGRSDKSIPLDDFVLDPDGYRLMDDNGRYIPGANNNPRGRYAVHFHHTGTNIDVAPAVCDGNAVISSAGWGFVNHGSNVLMTNNASYDVYGSHFVSEDGNELGAFKKNIAIKTGGTNATVKGGIGNHDHGHTGHGFWLHSRNLIVEDNIVSGAKNAGVVFYHRNVLPGFELNVPWQNLLASNKNIVKNLTSLYFARVPITRFKNTTVLSSGAALSIIKANNDQGHDARNMIDSLKGYALANGLELQYTSKYTFTNLELVADPEITNKWRLGVFVGVKDRDITFINAKVNNFIHPFVSGTTFQDEPDQTDIVFVNTQVDGRALIPEIDIHKKESDISYNYDPAFHKVFWQAPSYNDGMLSLARPPLSNTVTLPSDIRDGLTITGTKTDSLGDINFKSEWKADPLYAYLKRGYYTMPDGTKYILLPDVISDRLNGATKNIITRVIIADKQNSFGPNLGQLEK